MAYTYILECSDGQYYIGSTFHLQARLQEHEEGVGGQFTKIHKPFKLVYHEEYERIEDAFKREHQLKKWSHSKKEALINHDINKLKELSKSKA